MKKMSSWFHFDPIPKGSADMRSKALLLLALTLAAGCKDDAKPGTAGAAGSGAATASSSATPGGETPAISADDPVALAAGSTTVPGIGLSLQLPAGFTKMPNRLAYHDGKPSVVIEISLMNDDLPALKAFYLKNVEASGGKQSDPIVDLTLDGRPAHLFSRHVALTDQKSAQGFMIATADQATGRLLILEARLASTVSPQFTDLIRQSLTSLKWNAAAPVDLLADRDYTLEPAPGLKIAGLSGEALILNRSGVLKIQEGDEPRVRVVHTTILSHRNVSKEVREGYLLSAAQQDSSLPNFRLEQGEWIYINGLSGFEFIGTCDRKGHEGRYTRYTAAVYDAAGEIYMMVGAAKQEDRAAFLQAARATARTIKARPAPAGQ